MGLTTGTGGNHWLHMLSRKEAGGVRRVRVQAGCAGSSSLPNPRGASLATELPRTLVQEERRDVLQDPHFMKKLDHVCPGEERRPAPPHSGCSWQEMPGIWVPCLPAQCPHHQSLDFVQVKNGVVPCPTSLSYPPFSTAFTILKTFRSKAGPTG